jgi:hypothetical protein
VVKPSGKRKSLPEWTRFADLYAEIQVRTVLQHAWGAISRKLAYASVQEAPRDLQRNLNRLSALLELADDEFADIRQARERIEIKYDREVERGNLDLELDESSLEAYLRESGIREKLVELAREAGSPEEKEKSFWKRRSSSDDDESFMERRRVRQSRSLLKAAKQVGLTRIAELDALLAELWPTIPEFIKAVNDGYQDHDDLPISAQSLNWIALILLWGGRVSHDALSELGYVDELVDVVTSTY